MMNERAFNYYLKEQGINLNPQQVEAVRAVDGATLLLAVPGSGKTTTLIARIGYMVLCRGIDPQKILPLTYTKAATKDMGKRFSQVFGSLTDQPVRFQTINSLCNRIIDEYVRQTGGNKFALERDTGLIISRLYRKVYDDYPTESNISEAKNTITYIKNMMLTQDEIRKLKISDYPAMTLFESYKSYMRQSRLMDFDDQLTISYHILRRYPGLLDMLRSRYPYILVDEAQDTSRVQHEIIAMLAGRAPNLFMVGDEDQSIYGFRAAFPQALLEFENKYDNAQVLYLEENYRSTPQIVEAAGRFISVNRKRKEKHMFTERTKGPEIKYIRLGSRYGQYHYLVKCLADANADTAVLFRNNESAVPLIYHLRKAEISYRSRNIDTVFFSHKVVRDVRDFTAFAEDPTNGEVFLRIYHKTGLKIRKEHAENVVRCFDLKQDQSMFHTYLRLYGGYSRTRERVCKVIDEFASLKKDSAWEAIGRIEYKLRKTEEKEREKFFILKVLAERGESIHDYFRKLDQLKAILEEGADDPDARVTVSTVHSSKGLEYPEVYIIDAVDGVLPVSDAEDLEEERRIFYVAMTRAENRLNIMCYKDRQMSFVDLLTNEKNVVADKSTKDAGSNPIKISRHTPAEKFFQVGQRVLHVTEGAGTVVRLEADKVVVCFDRNNRQAKFQAEYCVTSRLLKEQQELHLCKGRPADASGRSEKEIRVYDHLDRLGIEYDRIDHVPAEGSKTELMETIEMTLGARICNNLFLSNRQRTRFYLLMLPSEKRFRSSDVSKQVGSSRLHFAEPEYMEELLGCTPGSASIMGLINDRDGRVQLLVDEEVLRAEYVGCHPCINTSSLRIRTEDIFGKFLEKTGHGYIPVKVRNDEML